MTRFHSLSRGRILLAALLIVVGILGLSATAARAQGAPGYVYFTQPAYTAHEDMGQLPITIARTDTSVGEDVRYGVRHLDAEAGLDLQTIGNTLVHFYPGQATYTFYVKIIDRGLNATPVYADAYLFGSSPQSLGDANGKTYAHGPVDSKITIDRDDTLQARDPLDLLGYDTLADPAAAASSSTTTDNPLAEAPFYVEGEGSPAGQSAHRYRHSKPGWYRSLNYLADQPGVHRFYYWNTPAWPAHTVARYLESVENRQPNTVVQLSTYSLVHKLCASDTSSPAFIKRYTRWVQGLARGIGNFHVVMFLELDGLITTQCMQREHEPYKIRDRLTEIHDAVNILETLPHTAVYIDAGAADAISVPRTVSLLRRAGVLHAQGFFVNSTHFDWTTKEVAYGQKIAKDLGGVHFVVNTGENGQGPLVPKVRLHNGNEELCNPPGRGLGPMSVHTGYKYVDGFLWFTNPGGSAGNGPGCGKGAPPTAVFWPGRAVSLVGHANFHITGPKEHLLHDGAYVPYDSAVAPNQSHAKLTGDNREN
jgi:endoglucanase